MDTDYIVYRVIFNNGHVEHIRASGLHWIMRDGRVVIELRREHTEDDKSELAGLFADTNIIGVFRVDAIDL